jgi:hypothetical protein
MKHDITLGDDLTLVCKIDAKALGSFDDDITIFDEGVDQALVLISDTDESNNISSIQLCTYWLFDDVGKFIRITHNHSLD